MNNQHIVNDLKRSGLDFEDMPGINKHQLGYEIPFINPQSGERMKDIQGRPFSRIKILEPENGAPKYLSKPNSGMRCYILPEVHEALIKNNESPIFLTEGEKKSAKATKEKFPTIGLAGIWGWLESKERRLNGEYTLHPDISQYVRESPRKVYIIFDSDCTDPEKAKDFDNCALRLSIELSKFKSRLYRINLPPGPNFEKTGLDDFFVQGGNLDGIKNLIELAQKVPNSLKYLIQTVPWQQPAPIEEKLPAAVPWDWSIMPEKFRRMGEAISRTFNIADEMVAAGMLGISSIALGNKITVEIKDTDHKQYPNLFFFIAAPVAAGKSPLARILKFPITEWQKEKRHSWEKQNLLYEAGKKAITAKIKYIEKNIGDTDLDNVTEEIIQLQSQIGTPPTEPLVFIDDITSEALGIQMNASGGAVGVISGEARKLVSIICGRYSGHNDIDVWLKGHAGDYLRIDRVGRSPVDIYNACLSALIMSQYDSLKILSSQHELRESGFLARWLYVIADLTPGEYPTENLGADLRAEYKNEIFRLLDSPIKTVALTMDAFSIWKQFHDDNKKEIMYSLPSASPIYTQWLSKLPEHLARIATVVHEMNNGGLRLSKDSMKTAIAITCFLKFHAQRAISLMGESVGQNKIQRVWHWISSHRKELRTFREKDGIGSIEAVKTRDIVRAGVAGLKKVTIAKEILEYLEIKGYLQHSSFKHAKGKQEFYLIIPENNINTLPTNPTNRQS